MGSYCGKSRLIEETHKEKEEFRILAGQRHVAPLSPDFFADAAWCHMAAFLQKIGGEGNMALSS